MAAPTLSPPPPYQYHSPLLEPEVASNDADKNQPVLLREPVVIPQRRPGSKERGFIRAYAPCLEERGIGQEAFLNFLSECNQALQGSASIQAVRLGAGVISLAPDPSGISNGVSAGIGAAAAAAAVIKSTTK